MTPSRALSVLFVLTGAGTAAAQSAPTSCPSFPDTREGQIDRGICSARKLMGLATTRDIVTQICEQDIPCVVGVCHVARNVCKGVLDAKCDHGGVELPADGPAFRNAACRAPRAGCTSGTDEEKKICAEIKARLPSDIPLPDKPTSTDVQFVNPKYYVVSVLYAPPGKGSEVSYGTGSTLGAKTSFSMLFGAGAAIRGVTNVADISATYTYATGSGTSFELSKSKTATLGLAAQADGVDHANDMFLIWLNPSLAVEKVSYNGWTRIGAGMRNRDGKPIKVVMVPASQLQDPRTMPPDRRADFAGFTPQDYATILKTSPFTGGTWSDSRFEKLESIQVSGPDTAESAIPVVGLELAEAQTRTRSTLTKQTVDVDAVFGFSASFILEAGVKVGARLTFEQMSTDDLAAGTTQRATVSLKSSTVGYSEVVDVYYDRIYKTFAFKGHGRVNANAPNLSGMVRDAAGGPVANQVVTVTFPNGAIRKVGTNSSGQYRIYEAPTAGNATFSTATEQKVVALNAKASIDLRAAGAVKVDRANTPVIRKLPRR